MLVVNLYKCLFVLRNVFDDAYWFLEVAVVCDPVVGTCSDNTFTFNEHNWIISLPVAVLNVN